MRNNVRRSVCALSMCFTVSAVAVFYGLTVLLPKTGANALTAADPLSIPACGGVAECFAFTVDTRLTDTLDTDPTHLSGSATAFSIPVSAYLGTKGFANQYNWTINWGDGSAEQNVSGTGSETHAGIPHNYASAGRYQITIRPNTASPAAGWMNAFGFYSNQNGANNLGNKFMLYSIDTPFTQLMKKNNETHRFAYVFIHTRNLIGIPDNLFANISTAGDTQFNLMFASTFMQSARNTTTASIPSTLFSSLDVTSGTNFTQMFSSTFGEYASSSTSPIPEGLFDTIHTTSGTVFTSMFGSTFASYARSSSGAIPANLFSSIDTSKGTDLESMFMNTFNYYGYNSTTSSIPAGLFDSLDTRQATNLKNMFYVTFSYYAHNSPVATIPEGLFSSFDLASGSNLSNMFTYTFSNYGSASTVGTIPDNLFATLNTGSATDFTQMFGSTFSNYATKSPATISEDLFANIDTTNAEVEKLNHIYNHTFENFGTRSAYFKVDEDIVNTQSFPGIYSAKTTGNNPSSDPTVNAGDRAEPSYDIPAALAPRDITAPDAPYAEVVWHRTDGTSCRAASPTPDCGVQNAGTLASFPNTTEWAYTESPEKGDVTFYAAVVQAPCEWDGTLFEADEACIEPKAPEKCAWNSEILASDALCVAPTNEEKPPVTPTEEKPKSPGAPATGFWSSEAGYVVSAISVVALVAITVAGGVFAYKMTRR